jgi:hypothetical protein
LNPSEARCKKDKLLCVHRTLHQFPIFALGLCRS